MILSVIDGTDSDAIILEYYGKASSSNFVLAKKCSETPKRLTQSGSSKSSIRSSKVEFNDIHGTLTTISAKGTVEDEVQSDAAKLRTSELYMLLERKDATLTDAERKCQCFVQSV